MSGALDLVGAAALPFTGMDGLTGDDDEAWSRLVRFSLGADTKEDIVYFRHAAKTWILSEGRIPFERCLHLPPTPDAFRRSKRDRWLCNAARQIDAPTDWEVCTQLLAEWDRFLSRGPWREWRDETEPPAWATSLQRALFYASHFNRGNSLGERQLHRITRQVFLRKSQ